MHLEDGEGLAALFSETGWATNRPAVEGFWHIWETLPQFVSVVEHPQRQDERAAWSSLAQVLGRLYERDPHATLVDYVRLTEDEEFEARPLLSYRAPRQDRLTLTTLHQSKGLEFDTVFIADAVEGVFPDLRSRESLLGSRHLSPSLPTDPIDYRLPSPRRDAAGIHRHDPRASTSDLDCHLLRPGRGTGHAESFPPHGGRRRLSRRRGHTAAGTIQSGHPSRG